MFRHSALLLRAVGYLLFALGAVGLLVPLLPTTVFWIGAAACFAKSSPALYRRIVRWPGVGAPVADFLERGILAPKTKAAALGGMALSVGLILAAQPAAPILAGALVAILAASVFVVTRPEELALAEAVGRRRPSR